MIEYRINVNINLGKEPKGVQVIESKLGKQRMHCVASGEIDRVLKLYMYAKADTGAEFFVEMEIRRDTKVLNANIKTSSKEGELFKKTFEHIIRTEVI